MKDKYTSNFSLKLYNLCQRIPFLRNLKILLYFTDFLIIPIRKPKKDNIKRVLVIYNYAFGDGVIFLSSFKHIKEIYKDYEVSLICQKGLHHLYLNQNIFDEVIPFDLTKATFDIRERHKLYKLLRSKYYDVLLDPIGANECTTNVYMARCTVASKKITIIDETIDKRMCPKWMYSKIYDEIIKIKEPNLSLINYYAYFIKGLGYDFKVNLEKLRKTKVNFDLKEYGIIFPSASTKLKCYPLDRYAKIAHEVYKHTNIPIMLCGTNSDLENINPFIELIKDIPYYNYVSKTSLLEFIELIRNAKYVITNDTSTYHIGVNLEVPTFIITGGYTYSRYVQYNFENMDKFKKPCIITSNMDCFNCDNKCKYLKQSDKIWPCLDKIDTEFAINKIRDLLKENGLWK